jgi:hypothetical protein
MSNQTLHKPTTNRRGGSKKTASSARASTYRRQTARIDGRRDGKPLIFGWGGHLTRMQKNRIQNRAAYGFFAAIVILIVGVLIFGVIQQNVLLPNETIASVNSHNISQDTYRKLLAYNSQDTWNQYNSLVQQQNQLSTKLAAGDPSAAALNSSLTAELQTVEGSYATSQLEQTTIDQLVEDQLIQEGIARFVKQNPKLASKLEPSDAAISKALNAFENAFPKGETYSQFLSKDNLSTSDVRAAIALQLHRTSMQTYLASLLVSPTRQVHMRRIETNSAADAKKVFNLLNQKKLTWDQAAKQYSLDPNTKAAGGDMGWVPPGTGDAGIELWAYAPGRKVNDITTTPIKDQSGTFDIVQILGIDPSRTVDSTTLHDAQSNALTHWLSGQRANPSNVFGTPSQTMMGASRNLPTLPNLNATLKNENPQGQNTGLPSGG